MRHFENVILLKRLLYYQTAFACQYKTDNIRSMGTDMNIIRVIGFRNFVYAPKKRLPENFLIVFVIDWQVTEMHCLNYRPFVIGYTWEKQQNGITLCSYQCQSYFYSLFIPSVLMLFVWYNFNIISRCWPILFMSFCFYHPLLYFTATHIQF